MQKASKAKLYELFSRYHWVPLIFLHPIHSFPPPLGSRRRWMVGCQAAYIISKCTAIDFLGGGLLRLCITLRPCPIYNRQAKNPCLWHGSASLLLPPACTLGLPGAPPPGPLGVTSQQPTYSSTLYISQLNHSITKNYITKKIQ